MLNFLIIYKIVFNSLLQRKPAGKRGGGMTENQGGNRNGGTKRYRVRVETVKWNLGSQYEKETGRN